MQITGAGRVLFRKIIVFIMLGVLVSGILPVGAVAKNVHFTDASGREISIPGTQKAAIASGSLAECWLLAGGEICAVTQDARDRNLEIPGDAVDLGSLKNPSLEVILSIEPEFVILSPTLSGHLAMAETLEKAGITYAFFDTESFDDYLELIDIFTDLTGRKDLYRANALSLISEIENTKANSRADGKKVLLLRSSSVKIKALNSETMVGSMLKEFGCTNIADSNSGLLNELSLEAIVMEDPEYIFITCMGDAEEAKAQIKSMFGANPVWKKLQAVRNGRCFYLEKELFHYKPNARWGESYEKLAELLSEG